MTSSLKLKPFLCGVLALFVFSLLIEESDALAQIITAWKTSTTTGYNSKHHISQHNVALLNL